MKILICGSRQISAAGLAQVRKLMERVRDGGHTLIVGDASGVDAEAIRLANEMGVPYTIYTPHCNPRIWPSGRGAYVTEGHNYLERDRRMAEDCDVCCAVWNGTSHGTKNTYNHAMKLGKTARLYTFR